MAVNRGMGVLLLATVLVSLVGAPRSYAPQAAGAQNGQAERKKGKAPDDSLPVKVCSSFSAITCGACKDFCPVDPLRESIESFFARRQAAAPVPGKNQSQLGGLNIPSDLSLQQIIAIVPDPRHTHLALFFDRSIDAIEQGAQSERYTFDRASMPWDPDGHAESDDIRLRNLAEKVQQSDERIPGLLIFRSRDTWDFRSALFVWVVGETPTGGIHKEQFRNALKFLNALNKLNSTPDRARPVLSILGPTFSGSLYSLQGLLKEVQQPLRGIQVQSGTVSSWEVSQTFLKLKPDNTEFKTFQESDEYAIRRFLEWVVLKRGYKASDVAVLSEEETAYGSFTKSQQTQARCSKNWERGDPVECLRADAVQLYFPRDISQLRSAYQHDLGGNADNSDRIIPRETLHLNLEDSSSDQDSVPTYSKIQTPLSQEAVMLGVVSNLEKHHSEFILIRATNPLDQLFLARYLRIAYPQGRIVTSDADLLFQREMDSTLLHGILTITPYSLLPGSDDEVAHSMDREHGETPEPQRDCRDSHPPSFHTDHVFPNSYAVGTYNATLSLLECAKHFDKCSKTFPRDAFGKYPDLLYAPYAEYGWPKIAGSEDGQSQSMSPPLQLTVLGRSGYWSLGLLDVSDVPQLGDVSSNLHEIASPVDQNSLDKKSISVPQPWALLCGACCGLAFLFIALLTQGSVLSASEAMANFSAIPNSTRDKILFIAAMLLVVMLACLALPWFAWGAKFNGGVGIFLFAMIAVLWALLIYNTVGRLRHDSSIGAAFLSVSVAVSAGFFVLPPSLGSLADRNLLLYRYVHITSGTSPVVPWLLLLAALLWWCWYNLAGAALLDLRRPWLPSGPSAFPGLTYAGNRTLLRIALPLSISARVGVPALLILAVSSLALDWRHPIQTLEGTVYDRFFVIAAFLVLFLFFSGLLALLMTWLELRRLLIALDSLPLRRGFQALKGFSWKPIWRLRGSVLQDGMRMTDREIESLGQWLEKNPLFGEIAAIKQQQLSLRNHASHQLEKATTIKPVNSASLIAEFAKLQESLQAYCAMALNYLKWSWAHESESALLSEDVGEGNDEDASCLKQNIPVSTRLAERFVCLVYVNFILHIIMRLRTMVLSSTGLFVFLLLSISSYPFEPKLAIRSLLVMLFVVLITFVAIVYGQMHRDATLSHITDTRPGELGADFWLRIGAVGTIPLLSLIFSHYPEMNDFVFAWLQPALNALK